MLQGKLKSKQGITLPVAMAITCVLVILSASLIGIALTSISTTSSAVNSRQAYLNAKSALEYAAAYYNSGDGPDLHSVHNEYMVMSDKEGGTTNKGAEIVANEAAASGYTTYVVADFIEAGPTVSVSHLKLKAYSVATDAFGKGGKTVGLAASYKVGSGGATVPPFEITYDEQEEVVQYGVNLHIKTYPGMNWTPFYYLWTYKDVEGLYSVTDNCYGLETYYKSKSNVLNSTSNGVGPLVYYKENSSGDYVKSTHTIPQAVTENNKHTEAPSPWNAVGDVGDPRNGPATCFGASGDGSYTATYYTDDDNVNFFNIIITKKGQVLNGNGGSWHPETQTSEMFHLWYLFNDDKNVYFEFLKPDMQYRPGSDWDGLETLSDRMLVYVKNKKTTVHFRVKGIGDTEDEANNSHVTNQPVINSVNIDGVSIFNNSSYYSNFSNGNASLLPDSVFNNSSLEQIWQLNFMNGNEGRTSQTGYFYGLSATGQDRMLYEGCGWWVANIACGERFSMTFTYYDKSGNPTTSTVSVSPNTNNEAFITVDPANPSGIRSNYSEQQACENIGLDYKSYTTVRVKASQTGTAVAPYIDYKKKNVSTTAKRQLIEKINQVRSSYLVDDYEDASFNNLQSVLNVAIELVNDGTVHPDNDYNEQVTKIDEAVAALRTKGVSNELYTKYKQLVDKCTEVVNKQASEVTYDAVAYAMFTAPGGEYEKALGIIQSGEILSGTGASGTSYNSSMVYDLIDALEEAYREVLASELDKNELNAAITEAEGYVDNVVRFKQEYLDLLNEALSQARGVKVNGPSQADIDTATENLRNAIEELLANPNIDIDTRRLVELISRAQTRLNDKTNCTDESYNALQSALNEANTVVMDYNTTQERVDEAYDKLLKEYDGYFVYKPGYNISTSTDSYATDRMLSENKIRIWVEGLLTGTVIRSYTNDSNGSVVTDDDPIEVTGLTMQLFKNDQVVGNYSMDAMNKIQSQNLIYKDVGLNSFDKVEFTVTAVQNELGEINPSTGRHQILSSRTIVFQSREIAVDDMRDGNLVFSFSNLVMSEAGSAVQTNRVEFNRMKMSELFIMGTPNAVVEVTNSKGKVAYNTIREGDYLVARYLYGTTRDYVEKVQVRYYSVDDMEYLYTNSFDSQIGQYVLKVDESVKEDMSTVKINIPYDSPSVKGDDTVFVGVKIGENEPVEAFYDGSQYVYTAEYTAPFTFTIYRRYGDDGRQEVSTGGLNVNAAGEIHVTYTSDTAISGAYSPYTFKRVRSELISVNSIYPKYSLSSGSGSGTVQNSVGELNGIVSTTFADDLLTVPTVTSAVTTTTRTVQFDYFNQVGLGGEPTINQGNTVIWIDADNRYLNKQQPWVYVWDRNDRGLNGEWPGIAAQRVDPADDYYYVIVQASAYGCIITTNAGANKIGGTPAHSSNDGSNNGGEIYLDMADSLWYEDNEPVKYPTNWNENCYGRTKQLLHNSFARPFACDYNNRGQRGGCCLFTIIDEDVLSAAGYTVNLLSSTFSYSYSGDDVCVYDYHGPTGNKCPDRSGHRAEIWPYAPGQVVNYGVGTSLGGAYSYKYRAKRSDTAPYYMTEVVEVERDDMDAKDLRMPFVGGSKIRIQNQSYEAAYSTYLLTSPHRQYLSDSAFKSENSTPINGLNPFGGSGGNRSSMGRAGDADLSILFDWYERKIPVDQSDEYTFHIQGLQYTSHATPGKSWYDDGYKTDDIFTQQVQDVYGNVWLTMKGIQTDGGIFKNMTLSSVDPEQKQIADEQAIYFRTNSNIASVKIDTAGVGTGETYNMTSDPEHTSSYLYAKIPAKTPFLRITVQYNDGTTKLYKTTLQGDDLILFDPTMNYDGGGWDNYVPHKVALERALYSAHALYYGKVLPRQYKANGNPADLGSNGGLGSYKYANAIRKNIVDRYFTDGEINSSGYSANIDTINNWVAAYQELYNTMSDAREYIPGRNYPEYLHSSHSTVYADPSFVAQVTTYLDEAERIYEDENTTITQVIQQAERLTNGVRAVVSDDSGTSDYLRFVFYDWRNNLPDGSTVILRYSQHPSSTVIETETTAHMGNGEYPVFYVSPASGEDYIFNVQFVIKRRDGTSEECMQMPGGMIDLKEVDWFYQYTPGASGDLSEWVGTPRSDVRMIPYDKFKQNSAGEKHEYSAVSVREKINESHPVATTEAGALNRSTIEFKSITLDFKQDCYIETVDPNNRYTIKAGAYTFDYSYFNTQSEVNAGADGPFIYKNVGSEGWKPTIDLFSSLAKEYFTNPANYGEYSGGTDAVSLPASPNAWVTQNGTKNTITAGMHSTSQTVNMTVNDGAFAASRVQQYQTTGSMYFRWEGNQTLKVYNDISVKANEFKIAVAGTIDASTNSGKHFKVGTFDDADTMVVDLLTNLKINYKDIYGQDQEFTIYRGTYQLSRPDGQTGYIGDLFDREYWLSEYVEALNDGRSTSVSGQRLDFSGNLTYTRVS